MTRTLATAFLFAFLLSACGDSSEWQELGSQLTPEQEQQGRRAVRARDEMFKQLFARLQGAMKEGGPAQAISVCKTAAPTIATAVGKEFGLTIGRTARKLRNPENAAPAWAAGYVNGDGGEPVQLAHPDGRYAALLPIRLKMGCLGCHGPQDQIQPEVRKALGELYPEDRATGFAKGDLRGWFWVEVPAAP